MRRLAAAVLLALAGCGGDDEPSGEPADEGLAAFCRVMTEEVPEEHVGTDEHVRDLDALVAAAPDEVRDDVRTMRDHIATEVDPDDPDSKLIDGYPDDVQEALSRLRAFAEARC